MVLQDHRLIPIGFVSAVSAIWPVPFRIGRLLIRPIGRSPKCMGKTFPNLSTFKVVLEYLDSQFQIQSGPGAIWREYLAIIQDSKRHHSNCGGFSAFQVRLKRGFLSQELPKRSRSTSGRTFWPFVIRMRYLLSRFEIRFWKLPPVLTFTSSNEIVR